jgi:hypothetical protein
VAVLVEARRRLAMRPAVEVHRRLGVAPVRDRAPQPVDLQAIHSVPPSVVSPRTVEPIRT